jgi:hypothetical protein
VEPDDRGDACLPELGNRCRQRGKRRFLETARYRVFEVQNDRIGPRPDRLDDQFAAVRRDEQQ